MTDNFYLEEVWAGYKNLVVKGKNVAFLYMWQDVSQDYLKQVVEKFPDIFMLENDGSSENNLLKLTPNSMTSLTMQILLDVVDQDPLDSFELVDLQTKTLLNSAKTGQPAASVDIKHGL